VFGAAVIFTALATIAVALVVRDAPPGHPVLDRTPEPPRLRLQGLMEVLRNPRLRPILALNFCNYACTFTVQGLWGGPYLREVHGLTKIQSGNVLFAAVIAYQLGVLVIGPLDRVLGATFGIVRGLAILGIAYLIFTSFVPIRSQPNWLTQARLLPLVQSSSEVLLSLVPNHERRETPPGAAPPVEKAQDAPKPEVPVKPKPGKHGKKGYGVGDRRALDRLFEATGSGGNGKP
jgi:predicted MFS family arabinose efflux permease